MIKVFTDFPALLREKVGRDFEISIKPRASTYLKRLALSNRVSVLIIILY